MTDNSLEDDDITTTGPTESEDDKDAGGAQEGRDTGDLPTEKDDDRDAGGEGNQDSGDEA